MLSSLRSRFDDSSLGGLYRYTRGWVEYGNPAKAYKELIYLFQGFTDLCNQHGIEYWLDWGTLLGYLRHKGGVIPWDYDHDVGMRSDEYERFIAIVEGLIEAEKKKPSTTPSSASSSSSSPPLINHHTTFNIADFTFARTGERGYYVMSLKSHPDIQIDIVEYITVNDASTRGEDVLKHNMDDVTYEGFDYPDMPVDIVFPLRCVNMLGCPTLIPNDAHHVTKLHFGADYMHVLWVPYLLTLVYNPFLTRILWNSPVRQIPILQSYIEGFSKFGSERPFMVRDPQTFRHITIESIFQFVANSKETVFGYDSEGELVENLSIRQLVQDWSEDRLQYKILDAPLDCCELPDDFVAQDEPPPDEESKPGRNKVGLGLMLTKANSETFLHLDPPFYGGGWMYLLSGRKSWTYISPEFIDDLYDPKTKRLRDLPISELTSQFGHRLHGKVFHVTAQAGDLVYFPPCWMHRVRTYEKTIGICGYMRPEAAHANMNKYTKILSDKGLNSIWNGNTDI